MHLCPHRWTPTFADHAVPNAEPLDALAAHLGQPPTAACNPLYLATNVAAQVSAFGEHQRETTRLLHAALQRTAVPPASAAKSKKTSKRSMSSSVDAPPPLTSVEAGRVLGVCTKTIDRLREAGRLPGHRLNGTGHWRYHRSDVESTLLAAPTQVERGSGRRAFISNRIDKRG